MPDTLAGAWLKAIAEIPDPRLSASNPDFGSKFVPRDEVLHAVRPFLQAHDIALTQGAFGHELVTTIRGHGEEMELARYPLPDTTDPQKLAAACTYASRLSLMLAFCLCGEPDDDGNAASVPDSVSETTLQALRKAANSAGFSDKQFAGWLAKKTAASNMTETEARRYLSEFEAKAE